MNCQEITDLLDNGNLAQLDAPTRSRIEEHAARCAECAGEWAAFAQFLALPEPVPPPGFARIYRDSVASSGATMRERPVVAPAVSNGRYLRRRFALAGSLMALAAAAAILVFTLQRPVAHQQASSSPAMPSASPAVPVQEPSPVAQTLSAPAPQLSAESAVAPSLVAGAAPGPAPITVRVQPLQNEAEDALSSSAVEVFYRELLSRLRRIPGIRVVEEPVPIKLQGQMDYVLEVTGTRPGQAGALRAAVRIRKPAPDPVILPIAGDFTPDCVVPPAAGSAPCASAASLAASVAGMLRTMAFPADESLQQMLTARLADHTIDPASRLDALRELASPRPSASASGSVVVDKQALRSPVIVRAAIDLATRANPAQRAQIWRTLRGVRDAQLIEPLISAAQLDGETGSRKEAVITLTKDFATDAQARSALDAVMRDDSVPLIRALARRAVAGEDTWLAFVRASLNDTAMPVEARVEPLILHLNNSDQGAGGTPGAINRVLDETSIDSLAGMLPAVLDSAAGREALLILVSRMGTLHHPAITDALLGRLQREPDWIEKRMLITQLATRDNDPRARAALQRIAGNDPDPAARAAASKALGQPGASEPALTPRSDTP